MFNPTREQVRDFFCRAWKKHRERSLLEGAEAAAVDVIIRHPEYHALLADPALAATQEYPPEGGQLNPFLHLSLHLAIAEQLSIDQPRGIRAAFQALAARLDPHAAEHRILECLGEALWRSQRERTAIDAVAYLECVQRVAKG